MNYDSYADDLKDCFTNQKTISTTTAQPPLSKEDITRFLHYLRGYQDGLGAIAAMLEIEFNA